MVINMECELKVKQELTAKQIVTLINNNFIVEVDAERADELDMKARFEINDDDYDEEGSLVCLREEHGNTRTLNCCYNEDWYYDLLDDLNDGKSVECWVTIENNNDAFIDLIEKSAESLKEFL